MSKVKGALTPEQQLRALTRIYGLDRTGYTFLPYIDGSATNKSERRDGYHEGRAFKWPADRPAMLEHLTKHAADDVYFPPNLFEGKRRIEQNVAAERVLYADLDPVDPRTLPNQYRPTIAWESSPGRFQAVWLLDRLKQGATWGGNENHKLTTMIGADPSGWDSTQLLRVPGRANFKPEYKDDNNGKPVMGDGLLWDNGPRYTWSDFDDLPPVVSAGTSADSISGVDDDIIADVDRKKVWDRVRLKMPMRIREYMALTELPVGADRSDALWDISRSLADVGCSLIEIIALTKYTVWNKFAGRPDELTLLKKQAAKAINHVDKTLEPEPDEDDEEKPKITWLADVVKQAIPRPRWLIKDIWTRGGLGFISGAPKSYKSWMALDMAISVATGTPWMGQPQFAVNKEAPVLYLQEEDDIRLVMERLSLITESKAPDRYWEGQMEYTGVDTDGDPLLSDLVTWAPPVSPIPMALHVQTGFIASDPSWQSWLDDIVEEGKFALVLIDTLGTVAGEVDTDKSGELMTKILRPLRQIARKHDTAICVVHHNKKAANQGGRAGQDMLGSTALHAWVECAIYARSKDEKGEIAIEREAKLAMDMSMRVKIPLMFKNHQTGDSQLWEPEMVTEGLDTVPDAPQDERPRERKPAGNTLAFKLKQMGKGPFTVDDIVERLGSDSPSSVRRQLESGLEKGFFIVDNGLWSVPR